MRRFAFFILGTALYFGGRYFTYGLIDPVLHAFVAILSAASIVATYLAFDIK